MYGVRPWEMARLTLGELDAIRGDLKSMEREAGKQG